MILKDMKGWKTKVGGIGSIASGVVLIAQALVVAEGSVDFSRIQEGIVLIVAGFAVLGIGHKIEKAGGAK